MRPVALLRFSPTEGPGYFAQWLTAHGIAWELLALDEGASVPDDPGAYAGIGMMGGSMSVNDGLPWIAPVGALLRAAVRDDIPVIGHCLGGQLLAQALGAEVKRTPNPKSAGSRWTSILQRPFPRGPGSGRVRSCRFSSGTTTRLRCLRGLRAS